MINLTNTPPKILVVGDLMVDHYLWGDCERISPEAPVQLVRVNSESSALGGAGNVVSNLNALGAHVDIISVIGNDEVATEIKTLLDKINVNSQYLVTEQGRVSSKKTRVIASQQQVVRYDQETTDDIGEASQIEIANTFASIVQHYDNVLLSDYGKGVLTSALTKRLIATANAHGKKVLVDPKGLDYKKYADAYLLTPNKKEASIALQIAIKDRVTLVEAISQLKHQYNLATALITLSEEGIAIYDNDCRIYPTVAQEVFDVTGAGDTVLAALGFASACDYTIDDAVKFANLAAGVVVGKVVSAAVTLDEIAAYESSLNQSSSETHIKTFSEIKRLSQGLKAQGKRIVFTNGCFDILHAGHIRYLEVAKSYGDVLILGLNSDASVTALKGAGRPINTQIDRAYMLAAMEAVDYVVVFDEATPYDLINIIQPHILVKGGDYEGKEVVGQDIVDELKLVPLVDGKSTSITIDKIQHSKR